MHPSGVQFGLSRGLLRLDHDTVLVSDQLLENVSVEAHLHVSLGKPSTDTRIFTNIVTLEAQKMLGNEQGTRRQEIVPFFAGLPRALRDTLVLLAEKPGLGSLQERRFMTDQSLWDDFSNRALDIKRGMSLPKIRKALFKECCNIVRARYAERDPDNARYADLMALFLFNFWNGIGLLAMTEAVVIYCS
jgi:hypothetical protein